mmetsp:Transcript_35695/g.112175  ORF Transcript_35695/g.112175 Transcript_35695/m.112175 type:complete len:107 (-) Transcript_35695:103-423(-)
MNPGITSVFDCEHMLAGICPRPLLILNGKADPRCPTRGVNEAVGAARRRIEGAGSSHVGMELHEQEGIGHKSTPEMWDKVEAFLRKQLADPAPVHTDMAAAREAKL